MHQVTAQTAFRTQRIVDVKFARTNSIVLKLSVEGPMERRHYVNALLQLSGRAEFSSCSSGKNAGIYAQWKQISGS
jgi:hypothetical protein